MPNHAILVLQIVARYFSASTQFLAHDRYHLPTGGKAAHKLPENAPADAIVRVTPGQKIHRPPHTGGILTTTPSSQKLVSIRSTGDSISPKA